MARNKTGKRLHKFKRVKKLRNENEFSSLTQVTPTHELVILESEQWIRRVQEFRMENNLHTVVHTVKEIAATNPKKESE